MRQVQPYAVNIRRTNVTRFQLNATYKSSLGNIYTVLGINGSNILLRNSVTFGLILSRIVSNFDLNCQQTIIGTTNELLFATNLFTPVIPDHITHRFNPNSYYVDDKGESWFVETRTICSSGFCIRLNSSSTREFAQVLHGAQHYEFVVLSNGTLLEAINHDKTGNLR